MTTNRTEFMNVRLYIQETGDFLSMPLGREDDEVEAYIHRNKLKKYEWEVLELNAPFSKELANKSLEFMNGVIRMWEEEGKNEVLLHKINYVLGDVIMGLDDIDDLNQELEKYFTIESEHGDDLQAIGEHLFELLVEIPEDLPSTFIRFFDYEGYAKSFIHNSQLKYADNGVWLLRSN